MNEIKDTISGQLQQLQMLMHRTMFNHFGKMHNPHRGQGRVLAILKLKPVISQKELTYLLNMSKQSVAELITKLEKSGYITRKPSEDDKRVMTIRLTEEGAKAADNTDDSEPDALKALDCLNDDELSAFSEYLGRIISQYEEQFPNEDFEERRNYMEKFMLAHGHGCEHWQNAGHGFGGFAHSHRHDFKGHGYNPAGMAYSPLKKGGIENDEVEK
ncbi:MAG: MarR family transcriptional regulator [Synergistaceae bacterium]|nr:MarR family transcriptional regulator [Synergistaceae bacterium]